MTTSCRCPICSARSSTPRRISAGARSTAPPQQIHALNPHVHFEAHAVRLDANNVMSLIGGYDLVLDGSDNFETRYLVSDACFLAGKPLITAALGQFDGSLTTIRAHERNADGEFNPTYRCLFPGSPAAGHGAGLRRSRRDGRAGGHAGIDDGAGSDPRNRRLRREPGRPAGDGRCARDAVRNPALSRAIPPIRSMATRRRLPI